jgi:hypothetical protein
MTEIIVASTKSVQLNDIKAIIVKHHTRCAKIELSRLRGLIRDKDAVSEMIAANFELEVSLAQLLNVHKWDIKD